MSHKVYSLSREQVRALCPSCADKMQLARIKSLKLSADELGNLLPDDETTIKLFAGFSQGLCDKFGPDEGLFTRCAEAMAGKVDDEKAFCASLEKYCTGAWPAEKKHVIREEDGKFVLYDHTGSRVLGTHDSKEKALAQERAIQISKAHAQGDDADGVWRTVNGRRIFIGKGEDVDAAMERSLVGDKAKAPEDHRKAMSYHANMAKRAAQQGDKKAAAAHEKAIGAHADAIDKADKASSAKANIESDRAHNPKEYAVAGLKNMTRQEVAAKCPECAGKMAGNSQDMPVDNGGHMQHICGKGGRAIANLSEELEVREYANAIKGIQIFKTGTHNGDVYTEKDLDDMVSAFQSLDYRPALKCGHTKDSPGAPAYGWVQNLRRDNDKLIADFEDMHDSVVDAIRNRSYPNVSSEIYFNLKRGGKDYRRALKAVALLGAEVPAVAGLTPLHKMEFATEGFEKIGAMEQELDVPSQALVDALAERVAGLVNIMKEYDMAKNTEKIAELKEKVDELNEQIVALNAAAGYKVVPAGDKFNLMGPDGKMVSEHKSMMEAKAAMKKMMDGKDEEDYAEHEEQIKKLSEQAESLEQEIHALEIEEDNTGAISALSQELTESKKREEAARQETKELSQRVARIEQERRNSDVAAKVGAVKIPAFRNALQALYTYAVEHAEAVVKVYSKDKEGKDVAADKTLVETVDGMVTEINAQSEKLFKALAFSGQTVRPDGVVDEDAGQEIDKRVAEYRTKHSEVKTYDEAMTAVLKADPELAQRYRAQSGREQ